MFGLDLPDLQIHLPLSPGVLRLKAYLDNLTSYCPLPRRIFPTWHRSVVSNFYHSTLQKWASIKYHAALCLLEGRGVTTIECLKFMMTFKPYIHYFITHIYFIMCVAVSFVV